MRIALSTMLFCALSASQSFSQLAASECPDPMLDQKQIMMASGGEVTTGCISPGPPISGNGPTDPPETILREVDVRYQSLDFNSYYGILEGDKVTIREGAPEISPLISEFIENSGFDINPNAIYIVPDNFINQPQIQDHAIIIGGGVLAQ